MYIKELHIRHFRGFTDLTVRPKGHVVIMGEPSAGRSNLLDGLGRVLDADASRTRVTTELDFHNRDTSQPIQISVTLAELGPENLRYSWAVDLGPFKRVFLHCALLREAIEPGTPDVAPTRIGHHPQLPEPRSQPAGHRCPCPRLRGALIAGQSLPSGIQWSFGETGQRGKPAAMARLSHHG